MFFHFKTGTVIGREVGFPFENVTMDEPEGICELEPGVFAAVVNEERTDGSRKFCVYKTMVPYNFSAAEIKQAEKEKANEEQQIVGMPDKTKVFSRKAILKTGLIVVVAGIVSFVFYMRLVTIKRERQRKLEHARKERQRIQELYEQ